MNIYVVFVFLVFFSVFEPELFDQTCIWTDVRSSHIVFPYFPQSPTGNGIRE